jgi:hypothetical protein
MTQYLISFDDGTMIIPKEDLPGATEPALKVAREAQDAGAPARVAPVKMVPEMLAPSRRTSLSSALARFAPLRSDPARLTSSRLAQRDPPQTGWRRPASSPTSPRRPREEDSPCHWRHYRAGHRGLDRRWRPGRRGQRGRRR